MKILKLMPDYFCFPIWHDDGELTEEYGDIDPRKINISPVLADELLRWAEWFDRGLNMNDPGNSYWSEGERVKFLRRGDELLARLRQELGPEFEVRKGF